MRQRVRRRRAIVWWGVVPGIALVLIIVLVVLISSTGRFPAPNMGNVTIIPSGQVLEVNGSTNIAYAFTLTVSEHVSGAFHATPAVQAYVLTKKQWANVSTAGLPKTWTWTSGNTTSASLGLTLAVGDWYIEFANLATKASTNVTITSAFQAR